MKKYSPSAAAASLLGLSLLASSAGAAPVLWTDWTSATTGSTGSAQGIIQTTTDTIEVTYTGEIAFIQTDGGANYWSPSAPYISATVDNAPQNTDIIALSQTTLKTLTFSKPVDNLFFAVVSLNGNGYRFNEDFQVVSFGTGYWGAGTLTRTDAGGGQYITSGTGEPHGVIQFNRPVTSISWTSEANEYWNGFTVGTFGVAAVPEPSTIALAGTGGVLLYLGSRRRQRKN